MLTEVFFLLLGFVLVSKGGALFVDASIEVGRRCRIPRIVKGAPDLSLGNVLGANVLNLSLISGLASSINPFILSPFTRNYSFPWLLVFVGLLIMMLRKDGTLLFREGAILLSTYVVYLCGLILIPLWD